MPKSLATHSNTIEQSLEGLPRFLSRRETADLLGCKPDFVTKLVEDRELEAIQRLPKPGKTRRGIPLRIPLVSLQAYLQRCAR